MCKDYSPYRCDDRIESVNASLYFSFIASFRAATETELDSQADFLGIVCWLFCIVVGGAVGRLSSSQTAPNLQEVIVDQRTASSRLILSLDASVSDPSVKLLAGKRSRENCELGEQGAAFFAQDIHSGRIFRWECIEVDPPFFQNEWTMLRYRIS